MTLELRRETVQLPSTTGRRQRIERTVVFDGNVRVFEALLKGFFATYDDGDHTILDLEVDLDVRREGPTAVTVFVDYGLRSSGNFVNPYSGSVEFVVIADVT